MSPPRSLRLMAHLAAVSAAWANPLVAQAADTPRIRMPSLSSFTSNDWGVLLAIVLCGAIGAFGADRVTDKLIPGPQFQPGERLRGWLGKLVLGSIAAVLTLALNPPGDDWWRLIGSALVAGLGAQAILLSIVTAGKVASVEKEREAAVDRAERAENQARLSQERTEQVAALARERISDLVSGAVVDESSEAGALNPRVLTFSALSESGESSGSQVAVPRDWTQRATQFADEITALATAPTQPTIRDRVLTILKEVLRRSDVEEDPIGQLGADREEILDMITHRLARQFDRSQPRFESGDVSGDDTLADITKRVRERQP